MTWTAPAVTRDDPPYVAGERTSLQSFLSYHRQTLLWKCSGLTAEQLASRPIAGISMSLLGLVRHMTMVERAWFRQRVGGCEGLELPHWTEAAPDADFDSADAAGAAADLAAYTAECAAADEAARDVPLDHTFRHPREGMLIDVRWVYTHMIEEYARHNGHADLLREQIDGAVGE